jgi:hypothetical protein
MRVGDRRREFRTTVAGGSERKHQHSAFSMERSLTLTPRKGDVIARYYSVVDHLSKQIQAFHAEVAGEDYSEVYSFPPVLVAEDVAPDILLELHSAVGNMNVKSVVRDRNLYIVSLNHGEPHSVGVPVLCAQAGSWAEGWFLVFYDNMMKVKTTGSRSPDIAIQILPALLPRGVESRRRGKHFTLFTRSTLGDTCYFSGYRD